MKKTLLSILAAGSLFLAGCENSDEDYSTSSTPTNQVTNTSPISGDDSSNDSQDYAQTGIIPQIGRYNFNARGTFSVNSSNSMSFSEDGYATYSFGIRNGSFHYRNGALLDGGDSDNGNLYPTDGFDISGNFTSETTASGTISYSRAGRTYEGPISFTATK